MVPPHCVLVTGGAGYIGSHTVLQLLLSGYKTVVIDNLDNSSQLAINRVQELAGDHAVNLIFHKMDIRDKPELKKIFASTKFDAVIHFAGLKAVGESVQKPLMYYDNNVVGTLTLLEIVFSSSATVYGWPKELPCTEDFPLSAASPYGRTKLMIEEIFHDIYASDSEWKMIMLRYFNPVGAHPSGYIGEDPLGSPNNLMPFVQQVAVGSLPALKVFGTDYSTKDGTGVRDYIHVSDLANGHMAALRKLSDPEIETIASEILDRLRLGGEWYRGDVQRPVELGQQEPIRKSGRYEGGSNPTFLLAITKSSLSNKTNQPYLIPTNIQILHLKTTTTPPHFFTLLISISSMAMATQASLFTPPTISNQWKQSSPLTSFTTIKPLKSSPRFTTIKATTEEAPTKEAPVGFTPPELDPNTPSPIFAGSTGGLLRKAQVEEFYVITWESPKEQIFEMPTGGAAIMREGPNLLKLARKEQCLALGTRLRSKYKIKYQFYRVFPNGEVQYLHPKDGVYPEKVNAGRQGVGQNMRSIGKNVSPIEVKFTGKQPYDI
ncbi:hypothetical protein L1987_26056 [Smallanthus sonchifolius]|uniref:Uncharacterized protein n=2 Tax=Smallanthus sonchifolius TaxID=185202 RepID=A0ACB9I9K5_9ASTR|nr:hypothetical protein L1987_26056 [Smallanthus sonchifolius]